MDEPLAQSRAQRHLLPEENALLARIQAGDVRALEPLVHRHLGSLLALARRMTRSAVAAEELVQETLVAALRGLPRFRGECTVRTWLFRIATRLASDPGRWDRAARAAAVVADVPDCIGPAPDHESLLRELHDRLEEAMERLPVRQRGALHLRAVEGLSYAAIASAMECSTGAARMLVLSARRAVQQRLGPYLEA
jgi:RNA polymerase sigma-70 factor (ECF subfamily)